MTVRTQTKYPSTVVSDDAVGTVAWSDPEKAEVEDNDPATATGPGTTEYLLGTGYGFTVPSNASPATALILPRRRSGGGAPAAWTVLGSQTLEEAAASVSFPGISTTYRMFRVTAYIVKDGTQGAVRIRFNNDSGANYDRQNLRGSSTTVSAARVAGDTHIDTNTIAANEAGTVVFVIAKQLAAAAAMVLADVTLPTIGPALTAERLAGRWNNTTDLIKRIDLISSSGDFAAGTVVVLEGLPD